MHPFSKGRFENLVLGSLIRCVEFYEVEHVNLCPTQILKLLHCHLSVCHAMVHVTAGTCKCNAKEKRGQVNIVRLPQGHEARTQKQKTHDEHVCLVVSEQGLHASVVLVDLLNNNEGRATGFNPLTMLC